MRDRARAVVIGGRVGGCSILYWLARLGWDDVVLVERAALTSGSTFVGQGASRRAVTRIPGGDVNPYLGFAAMIAAGVYGIENELEPPGLEGNGYGSDAERFPSSRREAIAALEAGSPPRAALGDQVVDHYLNHARTEQAQFDKAVTDWERIPLFERG
jgi:glutamine synthetase